MKRVMDFFKMVLIRLLLIFMIIGLYISSAVSSDVPTKTIEVTKGKSVVLETQNNLPFDHFEWMNNKSEILVSYYSKTGKTELYNKRMFFDNQTFSLTIKNTQETDSGLYTARAIGDSNNIISLYCLTVVGSSSHGSTTESVSLTWIIFLFLFGAIMI